MAIYGDERGMFWQQAKGDVSVSQTVLPQSDWLPPSNFPSLKEAKRISIDVETKDIGLTKLGPGVRRPGNHIIGIGVGIEHGPKNYYPIRHEGGGNLDVKQTLTWAKHELNTFKGEVVGANILYDLDFLAEEEITFPNAKKFLDIQVADPLLDENLYSYSLDSIAERRLDEKKDEDLLNRVAILMGVRNIKDSLWKLPSQYVGPYAEMDLDLPLRIIKLQETELEEQKLTKLFDIECRLIPILLAMRRNGVRIARDRLDEVKEKLVERRQTLLDRASNMAGYIVEPWKPETIAPELESRGIKVPVTKKTKKPSITRPFLERHQDDPFASAVLESRKIDKTISTFIEGYLINHSINGRVHAEFNQNRARTGRFSSSNPNLQNLPMRDEEIGPLVRSLFLPEEGQDWARLDWSQIEYRFLANVATGLGAEEAREQYRKDPRTDFHEMCSQMVIDRTGKDLGRPKVKTVNFGVVYGSGVANTAETMGVSMKEADEFLKEYNNALPFVKSTYFDARDKAEGRGYIFTLLGRRRRWHKWRPREWTKDTESDVVFNTRKECMAAFGSACRVSTHKALNAVLQGSAADLMKKAMVEIWDSGVCRIVTPLVTVHDELGMSCPRTSEGKEAILHVKKIMETCVTLRVPILADLEVGPSWGEAK